MTDNSPTDRPGSRRETYQGVGEPAPETVSAAPGDPEARPFERDQAVAPTRPEAGSGTDEQNAATRAASVDTDAPAHRADAPADLPAPRSAAETVPEPVVTEHPVAPTPPAAAPNYSDTSPFGVERGSRSASTVDNPSTTEAPAVVQPVRSSERNAAAAGTTDSTRPVDSAPASTAPATVNTAGEPRTVYIETPQPPKKKGNRGVGSLISLAATIVFAAVWAGVAALIIAVVTPGDQFATYFLDFVKSAAYWAPIAAFLVAMILLVLVLNRGGWPWYIIGGLVVAVIVYGGYLLGALLTVAQQITPSEVGSFLSRNSISPLAIAAGIVAREVSIWTGAAIAARGRRVKARNLETRAAYDRADAERKAEYERARAGSTGA
ncbi:hypothetical protein ACFSBZ_09770 [Amnibacterium flavum]|uniref:Uncharacterized protein n=1 Tax=Amnibacterium flavum TaxID=2173173 RepID=A0A2V1HTY0_9MICO|nr:hypothetical protein [Amnibacterium flavum]PVZ95142.1 hypothetical protein DDQ50_01005 [Amnibacterium flavum]